MNIVLFCGPPGAGKDTLVNALLAKNLPWAGATLPAKHVKFAKHLKFLTHVVYGLYDKPWDYYENVKDIPSDDFGGKTPREAYIFVSEVLIKPNFDDQYFGRVLINSEMSQPDADQHAYLCSDSGFLSEVLPLIAKYGAYNLHQVRLHRPGQTFANDSRSFWSHPAVEYTDIINNGSIARLVDTVITLLIAKKVIRE